MENSRDPAEWEAEFVRRGVSKVRFSDMMCNLEKCSDNQIAWIRKILNGDAASPKLWHDYTVYLITKFPNKKKEILRLVDLILGHLAGASGDDSNFIRLHLLKASFTKAESDALAIYEAMYNGRVGRRYAQFYVCWSSLADKKLGVSAAKAIVKKGIDAGATDSEKNAEKLTTLLKEYEAKEGPASGKGQSQSVEVASDEVSSTTNARRRSTRLAVPMTADEETSKRDHVAASSGRGASTPAAPARTWAVTGEDSDSDVDINAIVDAHLSKEPLSVPTSNVMSTPAAKAKSSTIGSSASKVMAGAAMASVRIGTPAVSSSQQQVSALKLGAARSIGLGSAARVPQKQVIVGDSSESEDDDISTDEDATATATATKGKARPSKKVNLDESVVVFNKRKSGDISNSDDELEKNQTIKVDPATSAAASAAAVSAKELKKKYLDENIMNFDPLKRRTATSSTRASSTSAPQAKPGAIETAPKASLRSTPISTAASKPQLVIDDSNSPSDKQDSTKSMDSTGSESTVGNTAEFGGETVKLATPSRSVRSRAKITSESTEPKETPASQVSGAKKSVSFSRTQAAAPVTYDDDSEVIMLKKPRTGTAAQQDSVSDSDSSGSGLGDLLADAVTVELKDATTADRNLPKEGARDFSSGVVVASVSTASSDSKNGAGKKKQSAPEPCEPAPSSKRLRSSGPSSTSAAQKGGHLPHNMGGGFFSLMNDPNRHVVLNDRSYLRLNVLGKGGSSSVYQVLGENGSLYAYKRVDIKGSDESEDVMDSYINEIELLNRLKGSSHIIELIDATVNREEMSIAMIMEVGDVDLAKVLMRSMQQQQQALKANSIVPANSTANPFFLRSVWGEMLEAVDYIHENRIVHGDLKPANFVFVRGRLKLIDFGIAKAISNDTTNIYRDSQIGTVNYMAPEAISPMFESSAHHHHGDDESKRKLKMKLGRASDIWSLGCILYQMIYGKPPFAALNTIQKLHAIPNPKYEIQYPTRVNPLTGTFSNDAGSDFLDVDPDGIASIKMCLHRDPIQRAPIKGANGLLDHPFLDLRLARMEWSKRQEAAAVPPPVPSRSETIFAARDSIVGSLSAPKCVALTTEEKGACQEIIRAIESVSRKSVIADLNTARPSDSSIENIIPSFVGVASSSSLSTTAAVPASAIAPSRRSLRSTPSASARGGGNENAVPAGSTAGGAVAAAPAPAPQPKLMPRNLMDQIQRQTTPGGTQVLSKSHLNKASQRDNKWMKPKVSPEKNDMRSILEKRFGEIRKFLGNDEVDDTTADHGTHDEFSLHDL